MLQAEVTGPRCTQWQYNVGTQVPRKFCGVSSYCCEKDTEAQIERLQKCLQKKKMAIKQTIKFRMSDSVSSMKIALCVFLCVHFIFFLFSTHTKLEYFAPPFAVLPPAPLFCLWVWMLKKQSWYEIANPPERHSNTPHTALLGIWGLFCVKLTFLFCQRQLSRAFTLLFFVNRKIQH